MQGLTGITGILEWIDRNESTTGFLLTLRIQLVIIMYLTLYLFYHYLQPNKKDIGFDESNQNDGRH